MNDIFSVERLQSQNALVAFVPKLHQTFREDSEMVTSVTPDGKAYVPWGADDYMPYNVIDLIEADETLSTCQVWSAEMCYGEGIKYEDDECSAPVRDEIRRFMIENPMPEFFMGQCQDMKHFAFAVSVIVLNREGSKIVGIERREACYCRFAPADSNGVIPSVIYGNFRNPSVSAVFDSIPLLNPKNPYRDLEIRMGRRPDFNGGVMASKDRVFAVVSKFPGVDSLYYPIPYYASLFRGSWYSIKRLIGLAKEAKLKNAAPIKYIIEIDNKYWEEVFKDKRSLSPKERTAIVRERKTKMMEFLTNAENSGSVLFTGKAVSLDGRTESPYITVKAVESGKKEGGDWESDIAEAINMICFTMHVHSNLVGSVPGKAQTNNSGSDKRELYTIAQALQKPYHDILFNVHNLVILFNGWSGAKPVCPFIQLTTLDEHKDAKEVVI